MGITNSITMETANVFDNAAFYAVQCRDRRTRNDPMNAKYKYSTLWS